MLRTQVAIIGAGPSGLLLSQLLHRNGIESIVIERQAPEYVEARIRAGLLEWGTVDLLNEAGVGDRMMREGLVHDGFELAFDGRSHRIDLKGLTGQHVMVYGQTEIQKDLADARAAVQGQTLWEARDVVIEEFDGPRAKVSCVYDGSMRSKSRSRYYVQCPLDDTVESWPDARFWDELRARLPPHYASLVTEGPSIERSIAPLRSFVAEPMRFGRLFLVGDAAHIVPPTGAKGLNLAGADVRVLYRAIVEYYRAGSETLLDEYSSRALGRVWKATRFSWWFTTLMHKLSSDSFTHKLQLAELDYLRESRAASQAVAENYVGLRFAAP